MTTRFEGAGAKDTRITILKAGEEIGEDVVPEGQVALVFNYDEVFYIQGTMPDVWYVLDRARYELRRIEEEQGMTTTEYTTKDTGETVRFTAPHGREDAEGYSLDGYDWIDAAKTTNWHVCPGWGKDGWDAGQWPYVILTLAKGQDGVGPFYGMTTFCEGDLSTTFYRSQQEQWKAITEWCRWNWMHGQGDGPRLLPEQIIPEIHGRPYGDEYDGKVAA